MPNIRTLADYRDDNVAPQQPNARAFPDAWANQQQQQPQYGGQGNPQADLMQQQQQMDDTFWSPNIAAHEVQLHHLLLNACCPCFVGHPCSPARKYDYKNLISSFIFWISIVQIVYFIVELCVGGFAPPSVNWALGPPSSTLLLLGGKNTYWIKYYGQVYRLVVPIIMHAGFIHLGLNLLVQLTIGLGYEKNWHPIRMVIIYVMSGIGGNLLSACVLKDNVSVGASGAIMGMVGAKLANIICRWHLIPMQMKFAHILSIGMVVLFTGLMSFNSSVDWAAHLGGLFIGFITGLVVFANYFANRVLKWICALISAFLIFAFFLITILMIYLVVTPAPAPIV